MTERGPAFAATSRGGCYRRLARRSPLLVIVYTANNGKSISRHLRWRFAQQLYIRGDCPDFCVSKNGTVPFRAGSSATTSTPAPTATRAPVAGSGTALTTNVSADEEKGAPVYVTEVPTGVVGKNGESAVVN